ncbi:MAG: hypothetical protein Q4G60_04115 [bacterium]|nr:hypothetical protein [bacterium]
MKRLIIIFSSIIAVELIIIAIQIKSAQNSIPEDEKEKVVIVLGDTVGKRHNDKNDIIVNDCRHFFVDYNKKKETILYINHETEAIEKNIWTGETKKIEIPAFTEWRRAGNGKQVHNLQYGLRNQDLNFIYDEEIYSYDMIEQTLQKITKCDAGGWCHIYQWKNSNELLTAYFVKDAPTDEWLQLMSYDLNKHEEKQIIYGTVVSFILNDDGNKIYAVRKLIKENLITYNYAYGIVEIDPSEGTEKLLTYIKDVDISVPLTCIDDQYLYYVEYVNHDICKVNCLNLQTGKKKCVYKTKMCVVGIVN